MAHDRTLGFDSDEAAEEPAPRKHTLSEGDIMNMEGDVGTGDAWWADVSETQLPARGPDAGVRRPPQSAPQGQRSLRAS